MKKQISQTAWLLLVMLASPFFKSCSVEKGSDVNSPPVSSSEGLRVPDGFVIERVVAPEMVSYPMFATLDNKGRLFVIESSGRTTSTEDVLQNPTFEIRLLEDSTGDGIYDTHKVFADKIPYPMGGTFYQGSFYVAAPPDLIRFTDTDGDGASDKREVLLTGWTLNHNAATLSGPFFGPDGWLYLCDARRGFNIKTKEGTVLKGKGARIWRCRPDGTDLEWISGGGFDNSVEMIFMPSGETIGTMTYFTEPRDGQRDALMHWVEGGVYPKPYPVIEEDKLKLTGDLMPVMTKLPRVSPAGLMKYRGSVFGDGFDNNLFSAEFNTGRIMRHLITPEGASFRTESEVFMKSDSLDTHPTDVLQDADGSLLVVNTGGWFIAGCPLSVVAKTDIHGGIFRIRKADAPVIEDPWGRQLDMEAMSIAELSNMLLDPRPAVVDHAFEQLIVTGDSAVVSLNKILDSTEDENLRVAAVFALYRIGTTRALEAILSAMDDRSRILRTAAARVLGLSGNKTAVEKLARAVQHDSASVRRQAATALGQIDDVSAIPALISASANPDDRFVEHAVRYALISLKGEEPVRQALNHPSENVRTTALIVLDQMDGSALDKRHLLPFLESKSEQLQEAGIWVASHHPEWSDLVVSFIKGKLKRGALSEAENARLTEIMILFSGNKPIQDFIGSGLRDPELPIAMKLLLLDVVTSSPLQKFPDQWISAMGDLLGEGDELRSKILDVVKSRSNPALNQRLDRIIANSNESPSIRLKALSARIMSRPKISDAEFTMISRFIDADQQSPVRQFAARLLVQAELSDAQLQRLAVEKIANIDTYLLPSLVSSFEGNQNEAVGQALITSLLANTDRLDYFSVTDVENLLVTFPRAVRDLASPLVDTLRARQKTRLSQIHALESKINGGDVAEGRKYFFGKGLCSSCHAVDGHGGDFGPDLTNIGEIRSQHDILEAILFPSASFAREYETFKVIGKKNTYTGIIKKQLPETLTIQTGPGFMVPIARNEIISIEQQNVSLMPPGLHQQLTIDEMTDLMAYLTTLPDGLGHLTK